MKRQIPAIFKIAAASFLCLAFLILVGHLIALGQRSDGEKLFWQGENVIIQARENESHTIFICQTHADLPQITALQVANQTEAIDIIRTPAVSENVPAVYQDEQPLISSLQLNPPRIIELPPDVIDKHQLKDTPYCNISESFVTGNETIQLNTPENSFVIDAYSEKAPSSFDLRLILGFLLVLWCGMAFACKSGLFMPKTRLRAHPLYAIAAFLGAIICTYFISKYLIELTSTNREILPGYGEMLVTLGGNFMSFFGVSAFIFWFWQTQSRTESTDIEISPDIGSHADAESKPSEAAAAVDTPESPEIRHDSVLLPFGLAFILSILAALSVVYAPLPGITLSELASQMVSTGYLTAYFAMLAGICEECLFRGVIQTSLMAKPNARYPRMQNSVAILLTTILFVLLHVPQSMAHLWALIPIATVSIVSGILRIRSGALYQSILLHISYNALLLMPSLIAPMVM